MALTKVTSGVRTLGTGEVATANMAVDPTNASNLSSGSVPSDQLGNVDTTGLEDDIALLGFRVASNGSLAKYNLVDQTVDDFQDTSGVDASASTGESRDASGKYYSGYEEGTPVATTYSATGATVDLSVTSALTNINFTIKTWGGGGSSGQQGEASFQKGGGGGFSTGVYKFAGATTLKIQAGEGATGGTIAYPGGGNRGDFSNAGQGGSTGGAYSGVFIGSVAHANSLIIAGGGGGGYYYSPHGGSVGGGGGGTSGTDTNQSGSGGTQSAGGSGGGGNAGTALQGGQGGNGANGGSGNIGGAGGGGGYYGGAGGGGYTKTTTTGAGGSGFIAATGTINSIGVTQVSASTVATVGYDMNSTGSSDSNYPSNAGNLEQDGAIYIAYTPVTYNNMTLVSTTTAAQAAPTKGDIVLTYTNGAGTTTLDTDLTAEISADGGSTWTALALASEGSTGSHNIATSHDVTISSTITAPYNMAYRIKTLNQSASKTTRIQAVSLGWS